MNNNQAKEKELPSAGHPVGTLVRSELSPDPTLYIITKPIDHHPVCNSTTWQHAYSFAYQRHTMIDIKHSKAIEKKTT
tara:strand:+ start:220 stop:453 length:234 start_codon:yes stop_codon:yes gene_type:complete